MENQRILLVEDDAL